MARFSSASGRRHSAVTLVTWPKFSSTRFGLYVGEEYIASTFPVCGSSATTAPQRRPSAFWAARCARGMSVSRSALPSIVAPLRLVDERLEHGREVRVLSPSGSRSSSARDPCGSAPASSSRRRGRRARAAGRRGSRTCGRPSSPAGSVAQMHPVAADLATVDRELRDALDLVVLPVGEVARSPGLPVRRRDDEGDDHADAGEREPRDLLVHGRPRAACMFARLETSSSSASRMKLATTLEPP